MIPENMAMVNVTWNRTNGELADPIPWDSSDNAVKAMATEAIQAGNVLGIEVGPNQVDLTDFVVDRYAAKDDLPNRIGIRPKTAFGCP